MNGGLVIRVDGDQRIGAGHVMRCLALAEQWQQLRRTPVTVLGHLTPDLAHRLTAAGCRVVDPGRQEDEAAALARLRPAWAVVDGYAFDTAFIERWRQRVPRLLVIDDLARLPRYPADCVLNQNLAARADAYRGRTAAKLLLGPRYALLRREFAPAACQPRPEKVRRLLVTLGGGDGGDLVARVLAGLARVADRGLQVRVAAGYAPGARTRLQEVAAGLPGSCEILAPGVAMPPLYRWADAAVSAGGVTLLELLAMGVPCAVVAAADNQRANVDAAGGLVHFLGRGAELDDASLAAGLATFLADGVGRRQRAARGQALVDTKGASRVVAAMTVCDLQFRPVTVSDADLLLALANDPETRANSFRTERITPAEHHQWLAAHCQDPGCHMWRAVTPAGVTVGVVRFESQQNESLVVSLTVAPAWRGLGLGAPMLDAACLRLAATLGTARLVALVRPENRASRTVFTRAGFRVAGETEVNGVPALRFVRRCGAAAAGASDSEEVGDAILCH